MNSSNSEPPIPLHLEVPDETMTDPEPTGNDWSLPESSTPMHEREAGRKHSRRRPTFFGIPQYQSGGAGQRNFDYDSKYPIKDPSGEEASDNARVWMIYNDEADLFDDDMLHGFRDTLDSLLVFAALFSAVVTTLLVQTSTKLEPDHAEIMTYLLTEQILLLRANGNQTAINTIPSSLLGPNAMTWSSSDIAVNVLFFVSLALSLSTALFSILVKQWLTSYTNKVQGTPKDVALTRHFRFFGLQKWKLPELIGTLPLLLHSSLWLFAAGLLLYVWQRNLTVFCAATSVLGITFGLYCIVLLLPPFIDDCPYHILFLDPLIRFVVQNTRNVLLFLVQFGKCLVLRTAWHIGQRTGFHGIVKHQFWPRFYLRPWQGRSERWDSRRYSNLCEAVVWLCQSSSNPSVRQAAAQSLAGILPLESNGDHSTWLHDAQVARALTRPDGVFEIIWSQLAHISLPTSSAQLLSAIRPASPRYEPWIRAESALHSWSHYWLKERMLLEPPRWVTQRDMAAVLHCWSLETSRVEFMTYIVECEDVWDPKKALWKKDSLDWNQVVPDWLTSPLLGIGSIGLPQLVAPISRKADINNWVDANDTTTSTPVGLASYYGHLETVQAFVAAGADLSRGDPPIRLACLGGHTKVVEFLLDQPIVLENTGKENTATESPFAGAIHAGNRELIRLLLEKDVRVSPPHRQELREIAEHVPARQQEIVDMLAQAWGTEPGEEEAESDGGPEPPVFQDR